MREMGERGRENDRHCTKARDSAHVRARERDTSEKDVLPPHHAFFDQHLLCGEAYSLLVVIASPISWCGSLLQQEHYVKISENLQRGGGKREQEGRQEHTVEEAKRVSPANVSQHCRSFWAQTSGGLAMLVSGRTPVSGLS